MLHSVESEPKKSKAPLWGILLSIVHVLLVVAALVVCYAAYLIGLLVNVLFVFLLALLPIGIVSRVWGAYRADLEAGFVRNPLSKELRTYLLQFLNRWIFLILLGVTLRLAIIPAQFSPEVYRNLQVLIWGAIGLLMVFALFPRKKVRISTNSFFAVGWLFLGVELLRIHLPPSISDTVSLAPPFRDEWHVFQGGHSSLLNHHYPIQSQRYALDLIKTKDGLEAHGDKAKLDSYPAYGQSLYAPADGAIVDVVNDRPDLPIGQTDRERLAGNYLVIDIGEGRFVLMAHLKHGSVRVSVGEIVRSGQVVAECGNSGNTSQPHLHIQVQSHADFQTPNLRTFPIAFRDVVRVRANRSERLRDADVRRNDVLIAPE